MNKLIVHSLCEVKMCFTNASLQPETHTHTQLHAFYSKMCLQIFCCIMLQPSQRLGWCHCVWLIGGTVCCCCWTVSPKIDSFRADTLIQSLPWCSGLKLKKTVGPTALWWLSRALLIYDVIFRLDYIFDAAYLSSLIASENSGVSVNLSVCTRA